MRTPRIAVQPHADRARPRRIERQHLQQAVLELYQRRVSVQSVPGRRALAGARGLAAPARPPVASLSLGASLYRR